MTEKTQRLLPHAWEAFDADTRRRVGLWFAEAAQVHDEDGDPDTARHATWAAAVLGAYDEDVRIAEQMLPAAPGLEIEMFQLVIVDNSGYESEIVAVLPHQYATAEAGRADRDVIELHKPSDRFASWEVWSTDRIAGRGDGSPVDPSDDVQTVDARTADLAGEVAHHQRKLRDRIRPKAQP